MGKHNDKKDDAGSIISDLINNHVDVGQDCVVEKLERPFDWPEEEEEENRK